MLPPLTLVLGGAASGKSAWAERLIQAEVARPVYIATAQAFDAEMQAKIARHKVARGPDWITIEAPLDLAGALGWHDDIPALVDCATLWLSNHLLADTDLDTLISPLLDALAARRAPVVIVSNEVGQGIVPDSALGRTFREAQGRLNIALAAESALVVQVIAGLPNVLKGTLP